MNAIFSDLRSIGIFFNSNRTDSKESLLTPEDVIINALPILRQDYLTLQLLYTWIHHHHGLIHAESMAKKLEKNKISNVEKAFLGGLLVSSQDRRLMNVAKEIPPTHDDFTFVLSKSLRMAAEMGQVPYDKNFADFGLKINRLELEDSKKLIPMAMVVRQNPFLYCRTLFGTNWRADIAAYLSLKPDSNPTKISEDLGCSYETAHRNYQSLKLIQWPNLSFNAYTA